MITPTKVSMEESNSKTWLDLLWVGLGMVSGGLITLIGLWLWLDYRADPTHSLMTHFSASMVAILPDSWQATLTGQAQMMGLPLTAQTQAYWFMARAGGLVGYLVLWLSVMGGLILSTKVTDGVIPASIAYGLHEFLSLGSVLFVSLHALVLLGDSYIGFNIFHLAVPFSAPYKPLWTGLGTLAFYLIIALTGSFYLRKQIGQKLWRSLHYLTFLAYVLGLVHGLMAGTDSALTVIKLMYLLTGFSVLFLAYYRLFTLKVKIQRISS